MKSYSFKKVLCLSALLAFSVGCGKDNTSSGGGPATGVAQNPVQLPPTITPVDPNMNLTGQPAVDALKAWYASGETASLGSYGSFTKKQESKQSTSFSLGGSLCIFGWGLNCGAQQPQATHCFVRNPDGSTYGLGAPSGFSCAISQTVYNKANNTDLNKAVYGTGMNLLYASVQNKVFYMVYGQNIQSPEVVFTIDTNIHSLLNPVRIETLYSKTEVKNLSQF